jgi:ABC-type hemin transport system ATPase subunit
MNWHHMFGVLVQDFFRGTSCVVELERDLSVESQFLDVLVVLETGDVIDRGHPRRATPPRIERLRKNRGCRSGFQPDWLHMSGWKPDLHRFFHNL